MARPSGRKAVLNGSRLASLEDRLGHRFKSHERLVRALTHTSAATQSASRAHYERLEFLGDRVLGLCVAERLFTTFPDATEGELSVRLNGLVSGATCAAVADEIGLADYIFAGTDSHHIHTKRMKSVRADVVESVIAAVYLDGGLKAATAFVERFWASRFDEAGAATPDSKTALQEWTHAYKGATPNYDLIDRSGPDHDPTFVVAVRADGLEETRGTGRSKRSAEQAAAEAMLLREGVWQKSDDGALTVTTND